MEHIRVLLSGMPRMLREIVAQLVSAEPDMVVVGELPADAELALAAERLEADVVVLVADGGGLPAAGREVLYASPRAKVLAVEAGGRQASLYELRPHETVIDEVAPRDLVSTIRLAAMRVTAGASRGERPAEPAEVERR